MSQYDDRLLLPKRLMAEAFGISVQAFAQWKVRPVKKVGREVLYFLPDVIEWRMSRDLPDDDGEEGGEGVPRLDPSREKARLDKAKADHEEIKVQKLLGTLLPADQVEEHWTNMLLACRAKLLAMPTKLAPQVAAESDPMEAEKIVREEVDAALMELSEYDPNQYGQDESGDDEGDEEGSPAPADNS